MSPINCAASRTVRHDMTAHPPSVSAPRRPASERQAESDPRASARLHDSSKDERDNQLRWRIVDRTGAEEEGASLCIFARPRTSSPRTPIAHNISLFASHNRPRRARRGAWEGRSAPVLEPMRQSGQGHVPGRRQGAFFLQYCTISDEELNCCVNLTPLLFCLTFA